MPWMPAETNKNEWDEKRREKRKILKIHQNEANEKKKKSFVCVRDRGREAHLKHTFRITTSAEYIEDKHLNWELSFACRAHTKA